MGKRILKYDFDSQFTLVPMSIKAVRYKVKMISSNLAKDQTITNGYRTNLVQGKPLWNGDQLYVHLAQLFANYLLDTRWAQDQIGSVELTYDCRETERQIQAELERFGGVRVEELDYYEPASCYAWGDLPRLPYRNIPIEKSTHPKCRARLGQKGSWKKIRSQGCSHEKIHRFVISEKGSICLSCHLTFDVEGDHDHTAQDQGN